MQIPTATNKVSMHPVALVQEKREQILRISAAHGARNVRIFGSVARNEASDASDIDFLVELEPGSSLLDLGGLLVELEQLLARRVDIVTEQGLHWYLRDKIINEARPL
ncbi:nucleotidyltransferase family protein [Desulfobulbus alkaliphilus]|uniref:nucleotidyltransferase family protein n=1 Tax=Desulfobulbus alkaliphilus TaxID=869814 RepID=UPI001965FDBE|nr:nucleotidyltransferase family protein [Desulfobulbus alkaliphilus]MBM9537669.1 nucleotidyltransferase family protein [Desulfobulbus alkaliphilus]